MGIGLLLGFSLLRFGTPFGREDVELPFTIGVLAKATPPAANANPPLGFGDLTTVERATGELVADLLVSSTSEAPPVGDMVR